jgi:Flp pilus assembly pilin Flp
MRHLFKCLKQQITSEKGQDAAEYALLIGLIALVIVVGIIPVAFNLNAIFGDIRAAFEAAF